jgi:DNA repair exonuclease SbcCD ATPase subunit
MLRDKVAECSGQLEGAEGHLLDVSEAIEAEARAGAEVRRLTLLSEDLDEATKFLTAAQQKVHADIAPVLNDTIRPWVPRVTKDRYDDVRVNPATLELEAHETGGQFRPATILSQGTTEQLFLLLRLALAQHLATTSESAPIILDDVTAQSDTGRTIEILDLLHDISADHQVVLFSQEDEVLRWAKENIVPPLGRLISLGSQQD